MNYVKKDVIQKTGRTQHALRDMAHWFHGIKHGVIQKPYRDAVRGGPSHGHVATCTKLFGEVRPSGQTDRQADKQTNSARILNSLNYRLLGCNLLEFLLRRLWTREFSDILRRVWSLLRTCGFLSCKAGMKETVLRRTPLILDHEINSITHSS